MLLLNFYFIVAENFMKEDIEFLIFHLFSNIWVIFSARIQFSLLYWAFAPLPSRQIHRLAFGRRPNDAFAYWELIMKLNPLQKARNQGKFGFPDKALLSISQYFLLSPLSLSRFGLFGSFFVCFILVFVLFCFPFSSPYLRFFFLKLLFSFLSFLGFQKKKKM